MKRAFDKWWSRSRAKVATKDRDVSWREFTIAWRRVERIDPSGKLEELWLRASYDADTVPGYKKLWMRQLVRFCELLQVFHGKSMFYLSSYYVAALAGVSQKTAWRGLRKLRADGVINLVKKGDRREANEYRFVGAPVSKS